MQPKTNHFSFGIGTNTMKNVCGESVCRLCAVEVTNFVRIFQEDEPSKTHHKMSDVGSMMLDCLFSDVKIFSFICSGG